MIVRIWHGRTSTDNAELYRRFVIDTAIPDYKRVRGNLGVQVWQREEGDITHVWTISWWDGFESIKQFTGQDYEKAKYYEKDKNYLLEFEEKVMHCDAYDFR